MNCSKLISSTWLLVVIICIIKVVVARNGDPPEVDADIRTHFKIPIGTKPFKLSCPVKSDVNDETIIKWSKDDEEISSTEWSSSPYRLLNGNRDLKIRNPQASDSGHYKCMAINGFGHKKIEFTLQVYDPSILRNEDRNEQILLSEHASSPIWLNRNAIDTAIKTTLRISQGESLELKCPATGNPLPKISWSKNGKHVNIELINPTSAKFIIHNAEITDAGTYTCRLENKHGSLEADFQVVVSAKNNNNDDGIYNNKDNFDDMPNSGTFGSGQLSPSGILPPPPPQPVIDQPYNSTVRAGHTAQFQCKVQWRKDAPTIRWLRKIENPLAVKALQPNATILHINNMHLLVLEQKNEAIQVQNNNNIAGGNNDLNKSFVNKLSIQNVQQHDSGRYFCVVSNAAGQFVYRSAYLDVVEAVRFSPLSNTTNIAIAIIIALVLSLVTVAVIWLCCNSVSGSSSKSVASSMAATSAPQQFSSTSSTSSSTSSTKYPKSVFDNSTKTTDTPLNGMKRAIFSEPPPPPPQIPLPKAPLISPPVPSVAAFNHSSTLHNGLGAALQEQQANSLTAQHFAQQQKQFFENHLIHHSQTHLHHDVSSPLLCGVAHHPLIYPNGTPGGTGIGDLIYPSSVTLNRRYLNQQRPNAHHHLQQPQQQQQQLQQQQLQLQQQHILHRTKAEDEMSRLSSHIYDILATNSPLPSHNSAAPSPTPGRHFGTMANHPYQQLNCQDQLFHHHQQKQQQHNWPSKNYAPSPAPPLPPTLPPPPHARPTTPASIVDGDVDICNNENLLNRTYRNTNQSQNFLHYVGQQQQARSIQRNAG